MLDCPGTQRDGSPCAKRLVSSEGDGIFIRSHGGVKWIQGSAGGHLRIECPKCHQKVDIIAAPTGKPLVFRRASLPTVPRETLPSQKSA